MRFKGLDNSQIVSSSQKNIREAEAIMQRAVGDVEIGFKQRDGETVLADLYQKGCGKVRMARVEPGRLCEAVVINASGGLTDGDVFTTQAHWNENTTAIVTTQAAELYYRCVNGRAKVTSHLTIDAGACGLWLPQETIMFDHAGYERETLIDLSGNACLVAVESTQFGRTAMDEVVRHGEVQETWQLRIDGRLAFADRFSLNGDIAEKLTHPTIANGAVSLATIIYRGDDNLCACTKINHIIQGLGGFGAASCLDQLVVVRLFSSGTQSMRRVVVPVLEYLLSVATDGSNERSLLPRVWTL